MVVAVGHAVKHVDILQVLAVDEARVAHLKAELCVGVAAVEVPERDRAHVVVTGECLLADGVELVVVERADVVEKAHAALVLVEELVVGGHGSEVLNLVTVHLRHALRGVTVVEIGVVHAVLSVFRFILHVLIHEEALVVAPYLVVQEVLLAVAGDDDLKLRRVAAREDAVAAQDEVLRTQAAAAALAGLEQQVEALQASAAGKR